MNTCTKLLLFAGLLTFSHVVHACMCAPSQGHPDADAFEGSSVVVIAKAVEVDIEGNRNALFEVEVFQLVFWDVLKAWKGPHSELDRFSTRTPLGCCFCALEVQEGATMILFADGTEPYSLSTCKPSRSVPGVLDVPILDELADAVAR